MNYKFLTRLASLVHVGKCNIIMNVLTVSSFRCFDFSYLRYFSVFDKLVPEIRKHVKVMRKIDADMFCKFCICELDIEDDECFQ